MNMTDILLSKAGLDCIRRFDATVLKRCREEGNKIKCAACTLVSVMGV